MENIICAETPATVYVPMPTLGLLHDHKQEREGHHYTFMIHTGTLHDHGTSGREKQAKSHGDFGGVLVQYIRYLTWPWSEVLLTRPVAKTIHVLYP